jgi:hypothetical protein
VLDHDQLGRQRHATTTLAQGESAAAKRRGWRVLWTLACMIEGSMSQREGRDRETAGFSQAAVQRARTDAVGKRTLVESLGPPTAPPVQRKAEELGARPSGAVHAAATRGIEGASSELPYRDAIQRAFGWHDVGSVRAQVGGPASEACEQLGAQAYASGDAVAFVRAPDLHTAAHEAAHVIQQRGEVQLKGGHDGGTGDPYEQHADQVAEAVVAGRSAATLLDAHPVRSHSAAAQGHVVQRREQNGPYTGNRPDPSSANGAGYAIHSTASRVMIVNETVTYDIEQSVSVAGRLGVRWEVINDPAAVSAGGVAASHVGPVDQMRWRLVAKAPGVHTIKAWVSVEGVTAAELTYSQQVVTSGQAAVQVPANAVAAPLATMRDFIAVVRRVEASYGNLPWQDVVTRIRKEYYPGPRGGAYRGIIKSFTWDDLIDEQERLPGLEVPPVAMADVAAIRRAQVVTTDGGESIDIGHILTGLDSFNFPAVSGIFAGHDMDGPSAATWSGDVGSALVHWANDAPLMDTSAATKLKYYASFAGGSDMLGDVDGLAMAHGPNINLPASAPLSRRLEAFYQPAPATGQPRRFHNFCRASRFGLAHNQLDASATTRIREQIVRFARGFNVKGSVTSAMIIGGNPSGFGAAAAVKDTSVGRVEDGVGWFADHFVAWVNTGLAAEGT